LTFLADFPDDGNFPNHGGCMQIDAIGACKQEFDFEKLERKESRFQGAIFSPKNHESRCLGQASLGHNRSLLDHKVERTFLNFSSRPSMITARDRGNASAQVGVDFKWGGKEDTKVEVSVKGEARDRNGNYVEAKVSQSNTDGGAASVRGGTETDKSSSRK
jgi:hypothetical protein